MTYLDIVITPSCVIFSIGMPWTRMVRHSLRAYNRDIWQVNSSDILSVFEECLKSVYMAAFVLGHLTRFNYQEQTRNYARLIC